MLSRYYTRKRLHLHFRHTRVGSRLGVTLVASVTVSYSASVASMNCAYVIVYYPSAVNFCFLSDEFPEEMKLSVQQDPYGQFYEDFYQVVVHGERRDDWLPVLVTLKRYFTEYPKYVNCCEDVRGVNVPRGRNSTSYEGNFLEAVNLSMNSKCKNMSICVFSSCMYENTIF